MLGIRAKIVFCCGVLISSVLTIITIYQTQVDVHTKNQIKRKSTHEIITLSSMNVVPVSRGSGTEAMEKGNLAGAEPKLVLLDVHTKNQIKRKSHEIETLSSMNVVPDSRGSGTEVMEKGNLPGAEPKLVLLYTPIFGRMPWKGLRDSYDFTHWNGQPCPVTNCKISYNKTDLNRSDAVIFHGRDMLTMAQMKQILPHRKPNQRWVYFMHENPYYTFYDPAIYNGIFNWTMTYRRDSDFFVPYNYYTRRQPEDDPIPERDYAEGKDKLIAWMVSNCGKYRDKVVIELMKYITVDVYGACANKFTQRAHKCDKGSGSCLKLKNRYKFYLAFENQLCVDYVTEKYWYTLLESETIPVVLGWSYDPVMAVPGSYISVLDFPSVRALAEHLRYLDGNATAYNEYFKWKKSYKIKVTDPWTCKMCAALQNTSLPVKVYDNLGEYWGINTSCTTKPYKKLLRGK